MEASYIAAYEAASKPQSIHNNTWDTGHPEMCMILPVELAYQM